MALSKKNVATYTSQTSMYNTQVQSVLQHTTIGAVTEVQDNEYSVALTPAAVRECVQNGHTVYFQAGFADRAGFTSSQYEQAGAHKVNSAEEVYKKCKIIMKVNPPQAEEFKYIQPEQVIFCLTASPCKQTQTQQKDFVMALTEKKAILISYNNIMANASQNNPMAASFPVHNALCEIAGYLAVQQAMKLMEVGGMGTLMGQVSGVPGATVLVLGANPCGARAAAFAAGSGANVVVMDTNTDALHQISQTLGNVQTMHYSQENLEQMLPKTTVLMGCVLPTYTNAPTLVSATQLQMLQQGAIAVDVAACAGGNFEPTTPNTIQKPTYNWNGITMYTATDITCMAPHTTSLCIGQAALPYVLQVANMGWRQAVLAFAGLQEGVCVAEGRITNNMMAKVLQTTYTPMEQLLEKEIHQAVSQQQQTNVVNLKQQLNTFRAQQNPSFTIEA